MATVDKHFRIKNGLVVEGQSATVNGNLVLTEASTLADLSGIDLSGIEDGKVLVYNSSNSTWTIGDSGSSVAISETAPSSPSAGDTWFDSSTGKTYIYYVDGDSSQWIEMSNLGDNNAITKLADVDISSLADGDILVYDNVSEKWVSTDVSTDQIQEGSNNLYFTNQRALDATSSAYDPAGSAATAASTAQANAIATAAADATNKASTAESNANAYTASVAATIAPGDASTLTSAQSYTDSAINTLGIDGLSDVDTTGVQDGNALVYDFANSQWVPGEGGGSGSYTISATVPSAPEAGDVWFDSTDGKSYIYYDDGDTTQWLEIGSRQPGPTGATGSTGPQGDPGRFTTSDTAPENPVDGDVWFNTTNGVTLVYYTDADSSQWVESGYPLLGYQTVSGLTDTNISSPSDSQVLSYDNSTSKWVNETIDTSPYNKSTAETGFLALPVGSEAERPVSPANGYIRFNTDLGEPEYYSEAESSWFLFRQEATTGFSVEYLIVAGGGGGGTSNSDNAGGGAGAGGYRCNVSGEPSGGGASAEPTLNLALGTYTVTVGAGGSGATGSIQNGTKGSDSVFSSVTSEGGGWGGGANTPPINGGDGGSGGGSSTALANGGGGTGTAGQGYGGGNGTNTDKNSGGVNVGAGGGGGAGSVGVDGSNTAPGAGGNGVASSITGSSVTRAGGGGGGTHGGISGGTGGSGVGGNGGNNSVAGQAGTVNTGSGGGGSGALAGNGGTGGSGIVIIKYPSSVTATPTVGLTSTTSTVGDYKVTQFTAGTGTVTFS